MPGHRVKQVALEFWPKQPQSFLGLPWALGAAFSSSRSSLPNVVRETYSPTTCQSFPTYQSGHLAPTKGQRVSRVSKAQMLLCKYMYMCIHICIPICIAGRSSAPLLADSSMTQHAPPRPGEHLDLPDHAYSSGTLRCRLGLLFRACTSKTVPDAKEVQNHTGNSWPEIIWDRSPCGTNPATPPSKPWCLVSQATPPCPLLLT